jgi:hypothetical protein
MDTEYVMERVLCNHVDNLFVDKDTMLKKSTKLMNKINDIVMNSELSVEEGYVSKDKSIMYFKTIINNVDDTNDDEKIHLVLDYSKYTDVFSIYTWSDRDYDCDFTPFFKEINKHIKYGVFYNIRVDENDDDITERGYECIIENISSNIDSLENILNEVIKILKTCHPFLLCVGPYRDDEEYYKYFDSELSEDKLWDDFKESVNDKSIFIS